MAKAISLSFDRKTIYVLNNNNTVSVHSTLNNGVNISLQNGDLDTADAAGPVNGTPVTVKAFNQVAYDPTSKKLFLVGELEDLVSRETIDLNDDSANIQYTSTGVKVTKY